MRHLFPIAGAVAIACCLVCAVSCTKPYDEFFRFDTCGGPLEFYYDLDGATLSVSGEGETSKPSVCYHPDDDPLWSAELDWIHAHYTPNTNVLYILAFDNQTGKERSAQVSAVLKSGKQIVIQIEQAE